MVGQRVSSRINDGGTQRHGAMVPWSLNGGRVLWCAHREEAPSSVMVALMVGTMRGFASILHSRDGLEVSARGNLRRMRTRRYLWTVSGSQHSR
jgi:hypothetical protein